MLRDGFPYIFWRVESHSESAAPVEPVPVTWSISTHSIYLYTGLHKRKVFDQIIHIMSKRINVSIYKHQMICNHSASAGDMDKVLDWGVTGPQFESSAGLATFPGK